MKRGAGGGKAKVPMIITIDDIHSDAYKLQGVVQLLKSGSCGVIPTDTCYSFVAPISSRDAIDTLLRCKKSGKKPLSFLCKDLSMISEYTSDASNEKWVYKMLKALLPGPFTFVLPTSDAVPKFVIGRKHPGHKTRKWKRREIGVRIPLDDVSHIIMKEMDVPLLTGSIPEAGEDYVDVALRSLSSRGGAEETEDGDEEPDSNDDEADDINDDDTDATDYHNTNIDLPVLPWAKLVDFIVVAGPRGGGTADQLSTIVDLTSGSPVVMRQGKGLLGEFAKKL
jgi:tRNA threonylcarbamoyl adenosine modification protein (Sua5/YciO/YrdC/YwlC family)